MRNLLLSLSKTLTVSAIVWSKGVCPYRLKIKRPDKERLSLFDISKMRYQINRNSLISVRHRINSLWARVRIHYPIWFQVLVVLSNVIPETDFTIFLYLIIFASGHLFILTIFILGPGSILCIFGPDWILFILSPVPDLFILGPSQNSTNLDSWSRFKRFCVRSRVLTSFGLVFY